MKPTIIFILTMILVILISSTYKPNEEILILGHYNNEKKGITDFIEKDINLIEIVNDINNNKEVNNKTLQHYLIKVKKIIINYNKEIDIKDLENLFNLIRKYCKEEIIFNTQYKQEKIVNLCNKKKITCNFLLQ